MGDLESQYCRSFAAASSNVDTVSMTDLSIRNLVCADIFLPHEFLLLNSTINLRVGGSRFFADGAA
jgi:hypothetical protein